MCEGHVWLRVFDLEGHFEPEVWFVVGERPWQTQWARMRRLSALLGCDISLGGG